jgi:hypothetical protein
MDFPEPRCAETRVDTDADELDDGAAADDDAPDVDRPSVRALASGDGGSPGWFDDAAGTTSLGDRSDAGERNTGFDDGDSGMWGDAGADGDAPADAAAADLPTSRCNARLVPMRDAPKRLDDPEWCAGIADSTLRRLRRAHAEFTAFAGDDEGTDPPPVPPPE